MLPHVVFSWSVVCINFCPKSLIQPQTRTLPPDKLKPMRRWPVSEWVSCGSLNSKYNCSTCHKGGQMKTKVSQTRE